MLGLEDAFSRRGGRGQLDSIKVPELVEAAARLYSLLVPWAVPEFTMYTVGARARRGGEATAAAHRLRGFAAVGLATATKEKWHHNCHELAPLSEPARGSTHERYCTHTLHTHCMDACACGVHTEQARRA